MSGQQIEFHDGEVYERTMGVWSRLAGDLFLDWLAPNAGLRWLDVGCGTGAFTELLAERCAPSDIQGIDPSESQLAFARTRPGLSGATFLKADAMALPFPNDRFDAAVMALVIFFVPDPAKGVVEMARVVRPGGTVASYAWDRTAGGNPFASMMDEMRSMGVTPPAPPSPPPAWIACETYGRVPVLTRWKPTRSRSLGLSLTSRTSGVSRPRCRACDRHSKAWRPAMRWRSKTGCACDCRPTRQGASPVAGVPTR
jgi:SAM-dependent methyltransferase